MRALTPKAVHQTLKEFFPAKNDDYACNYVEELQELNDFGITTEEGLVGLLRKRAHEVMEIDRSPMCEADVLMHSEALGSEYVASRLREGFWFAFPALLRIALELEFGNSYKEYAQRRDSAESDIAPSNKSGVT